MAENKEHTGYCPSCGKEVKVFGLLAEGNMVYRCMQCGMEADVQTDSTGEIIHEQTPVPSKVVPPKVHIKTPSPSEPQKPKSKKLKFVMMAEDSKLLSQLVKDLLVEEGFAEEVETSLDGDTFIQKFTESLINKNPPNLIILDINLPAIEGNNICVAIRAIEKAFGQKKPRPVLFFTSKEIDSVLKKIMDTYPPARYINKGNEGDPEKLAKRMKMVMEALLK